MNNDMIYTIICAALIMLIVVVLTRKTKTSSPPPVKHDALFNRYSSLTTADDTEDYADDLLRVSDRRPNQIRVARKDELDAGDDFDSAIALGALIGALDNESSSSSSNDDSGNFIGNGGSFAGGGASGDWGSDNSSCSMDSSSVSNDSGSCGAN